MTGKEAGELVRRHAVGSPGARPGGGRLSKPLRWLLIACGTLMACQSPSGEPESLSDAVLDFVDRSQGSSGGQYQPPSQQALQDVSLAVLDVADGREDEARGILARYAYHLADSLQARLVIPDHVPDGRGWGLFAVQPAGRPVVVEVPHPRADLLTENLGAALAERVMAQYLLVAGARRDSGGEDADVAHNEASLFAAIHAATAERGLPAVQVHGFAQTSSPGNDVVVSAGSGALSRLLEKVADGLEAAGFRTCRAWLEDCGQLEGETNVQGAASAASGSVFVHLEVSYPVRDDSARRAVLVDALSAAVISIVAPSSMG